MMQEHTRLGASAGDARDHDAADADQGATHTKDAGHDTSIEKRLQRDPESSDARLDRALDESMDASDPPASIQPVHQHEAGDVSVRPNGGGGARQEGKPFDRPEGYSGQDYHLDDEAASASAMPAGSVSPVAGTTQNDPTMPPDNGLRASFDPDSGAVRGSGSGAGGGNTGEDMASDAAAGDSLRTAGVRAGAGVGRNADERRDG